MFHFKSRAYPQDNTEDMKLIVEFIYLHLHLESELYYGKKANFLFLLGGGPAGGLRSSHEIFLPSSNTK